MGKKEIIHFHFSSVVNYRIMPNIRKYFSFFISKISIKKYYEVLQIVFHLLQYLSFKGGMKGLKVGLGDRIVSNKPLLEWNMENLSFSV